MAHLLVQGYGGIARVLTTKVEIGPAFTAGQVAPPVVEYKAIWDTGATGTVITKAVVDAVGLKPTGMVETFHAQGKSFSQVYVVHVKFPGGPGFRAVRVTEGVLQGFDVLIGMDIIAAGDFQVTNHGGKTMLAFQLPAAGGEKLQENVTKALKRQAEEEARAKNPPPPPKPYAGTGRNQLCPCNSGKKYKVCCGA